MVPRYIKAGRGGARGDEPHLITLPLTWLSERAAVDLSRLAYANYHSERIE